MPGDGARETVREIRLVEVPGADALARAFDARPVDGGIGVAHERPDRVTGRRGRTAREESEELCAPRGDSSVPGIVAEHEPAPIRDLVAHDEVDVDAADGARRVPGIPRRGGGALAVDAEVVGERAEEPALERSGHRVAGHDAEFRDRGADPGEIARRRDAAQRIEGDDAEAPRITAGAVECDERPSRAQARENLPGVERLPQGDDARLEPHGLQASAAGRGAWRGKLAP